MSFSTTNSGICRDPIVITSYGSLSEYSLPDRYVPAVNCQNNELVLPQVKCYEFNGYLAKAKAEEVNGLKLLQR